MALRVVDHAPLPIPHTPTPHASFTPQAGGVALRGVDLRRMESKALRGLHFGGELLDIDGVTGGFNFQACWTTGHIAGEAAAELAMAGCPATAGGMV